MSEHLRHVINRKRTAPEKLLAGVQRDCKRLFALVKGEEPCDHLEHLSAYCAMIDILKECGVSIPRTLEGLDRVFASYAGFVDMLESDRELAEVELILAGDLQRILYQLYRNGEDEQYISVVSHVW